MKTEKKKILIISPAAPFPLRSGADLAQHFFLEELPPYVDIVFCTKINDNLHFRKLKEYQKKNPKIEFVYFDNRPRKLSLLNLKIFLAKLFKNLFLKTIKQGEKDYLPYSTTVDKSYLNFIESILKEKEIDLIQFEFLNDTNFAQLLPEKFKKVLIHHEIWFKAVEMRNNITVHYTSNELKKLKTDELNLIKNFDKIVVFSRDDKTLLEKEIADLEIVLSPYGIPNEEICKINPSDKFDNFLFIGSEVHFANKQGLQWFLDDIYIPNQKILNQKIVIIGQWSTEFMLKYKLFSKIIFKNSVDKLEPYYENAVMLVPILSGSGLRTKILIALANNMPVITTRFAAEGLYNNHDDGHLLFFKNSLEFKRIISTSNLNGLFRETAHFGNGFYADNFSKEKIIANRLKAYFPK